jgi:hypothetical protein
VHHAPGRARAGQVAGELGEVRGLGHGVSIQPSRSALSSQMITQSREEAAEFA